MTFKKSLVALASVSALAVAAIALSGNSAQAGQVETSVIGKKVDNFMLVDQSGIAWSLRYDRITPAVVLVTYEVGDKTSRSAAKAVEALKAKYPTVEFALIDSSKADDRDAIAAKLDIKSLAPTRAGDGLVPFHAACGAHPSDRFAREHDLTDNTINIGKTR